MARTIGFFSGKGGSGKTTLAINLGVIFAKHYGKDVTLIDCNLSNSHVGLYLGMYNYHASLNHVLQNEYDLEDAVYSHHSGMKILPASVYPDAFSGMDTEKLKAVIKKLSKTNDIILLDTAPSLGREVMAALRASEDVIYIANPHLPSVIDVIRCQSISRSHSLGIALNMVHSDKNEMKTHEIEYLTELPVIASVPYDKLMQKSIASKTPIVMLDKKSAASVQMQRLAVRLIEGDYVEDKKSPLTALLNLKFLVGSRLSS